jgi:hypothetical protein
MKAGDIVRSCGFRSDPDTFGIVIEVGINMWNEELVPSGVLVLWSAEGEQVVYAEEVALINECG